LMTVASATAKTGPYAGNGSQTVFPYTFKVFDQAELQVVLRSAAGVETVQTLTTHYTVSGVELPGGGNVTMVTAPPTGATLTIVRDVAFVQNTDLRNQGGFYPEVHERVFDRLTMQTQQLAESVGRAVKLSVTSAIDPDVFNQSINTLAENVDDVNAVAAAISDVQAVAAIDGDVQVVAANVADVTNFADVYQGPKATDPTLRNNGTALQNGDLYFNTVSGRMRVYTGSVWVDAGTPIPLTITTQQFNGTGAQTVFTLSAAPAFPAALDVFISGVAQRLTANYSVSGTTLTFVVAPPAGTNNIYVKILSAYAGGVPNDGVVFRAASGTAASPGFAISGDPNTGIFSPGADQLAVSVAGNINLLLFEAGAWLYGKSTDNYTPFILQNLGASASALRQLSVEGRNENGWPVASNYFNVNTDGSGSIEFYATPSGARTSDRRVLRMTVPGSGPVVVNSGGLDVNNDLRFNSGYGSAALAYGCRAWVNFNGTGTVAIRGSGGLTSITDNGTGDYTANFNFTLPDTNYAVVFGGTSANGRFTRVHESFPASKTTTAVRILHAAATADPADCADVNLAIIR
jgi:hypothetical protein